ncbi:MAG: hypothetical protein KDD84_07675 [Caldilineaceae bacterium]|nr:hypothetical protein [Caldilineaceae bacterium]
MQRMDDVSLLKTVLAQHWPSARGKKVARYVDKFWDRQRRGQRISGVVEGNHGDYTVSIGVDEDTIHAACSCYIGSHGTCHHCAALAHTFIADPDSFIAIRRIEREEIQGLDSLKRYLESVTLDDLVKSLRAKGVTQKAFCEAIGMSTKHLSTVKSSELKNRRYHELGAIKLAVLWVMENIEE